jgi:hypothetical protein
MKKIIIILLKEILGFKCGFLKTYAVLELNFLTLYLNKNTERSVHQEK